MSNSSQTSLPQWQEPHLNTEMYVRLKEVESFYSFAGFKGNYHTLAQLGTYRREIILVEDLGLHLTWKDGPLPVHFIKPLPTLYTDDQGSPVQTWDSMSRHSRALLFSYTKLIRSELDFKVAKEKGLIGKPFIDDGGWQMWQDFLATLLPGCTNGPYIREDVEQTLILQHIESRFRYGDLRLQRLNLIFWFTHYGAHYYHTRDTDLVLGFWHGYGKWVIIVFAYVTTALTAMQVAIAASLYPEWLTIAFKWVSYSIICLILLQVPFVFIFYLFYGIFRLIGWLRKK